jgi:type III restriction enzyme
MHILNSHNENILLEFTATIDLSNEFIAKKYLDKIIYKYDLKQFRLE